LVSPLYTAVILAGTVVIVAVSFAVNEAKAVDVALDDV
jgi:hypothetical protein